MSEQAGENKQHWSVAACKAAFYIAIVVVILDVALAFYWGTFDVMNIFRVVLWVGGTYFLKQSSVKNPAQWKGSVAVISIAVAAFGALYAIVYLAA